MSTASERRARNAAICAEPEYAAFKDTLHLMLSTTGVELTPEVIAATTKRAQQAAWVRLAGAVEALRREAAMSNSETLPAPNECLEVATLLTLVDVDLRQRVPYIARLLFRDERPSENAVLEAARGARARVEGRFPFGVKCRLCFDGPAKLARPVL